MIEFHQLRQFAAVAECGTLSAAAEKLYISQPALTRSMQRLERDAGVTLFDRRKSKISLNENGKFLLSLVGKLTEEFDSMVDRLRAFDKSRRTITVESCAPAPLWEMLPALSAHFPGMTVSSGMKDEDSLARDLESGETDIIVTRRHETPGALCFELGRERLLLNVPKTHPLAGRKSVTFAEIEHYSFLLYSQIGEWEPLVRRVMPHTHFIVQDDWDNFISLSQISALPSFNSDLAVRFYGRSENSVVIPITDDEAEMIYYCHIRADKKRELRPLWETYIGKNI